MKKIALLCFLVAVLVPSFAQEVAPKKTSARPDIPGTFVLEIGLNRALGAPSQFKQGLWGSRSLNIYYQYELRILKSRFSFVPGIGFSLERWKFKDGRILAYNDASVGTELALWAPNRLGYTSGVRKSQLITNYFEIPVELCYRTRPEDPARSFKIAIGGRIGYLFDSFSKVKYKDDGQVKHIKDKQDFELTKIRYGLTGRIGVGNVSLFGYYNLNSLFESGKGPWNFTGSGTSEVAAKKDYSTLTIGISLASF
jgi:hypothetical protein